MKIAKIRSLLQQSLDKQEKICLIKPFNEHHTYGFVLAFNDNFVLIHAINNFRFEGYIIMPIYAIKKARISEYEVANLHILKEEGILKDLGIKYPIDLNSWQSIFESIKAHKQFAIVESEQAQVDSFLIGKLEKIGKKKLSLLYFDGAGIFEKDIIKKKYKDITSVQFDDNYTNTFSKYARFPD